MTEIGAGSLLTDSWSMLYNIFTDQLTDTSKLARAGSNIVFSAWPNKINQSRRTASTGDFTGKKWINYPLMVLTTEVRAGFNKTMNRTNKMKNIIFHADVYDKSKANADSMLNQTMDILDVVEDGLCGSLLANYEIESSSTTDTTDPSGARIHQNTPNWTYDYFAQK